MAAAAKQPKRNGGISDRTANIIIAVVTTMWVVNIAAGMAHLNGYEPQESINGIFLVIVGGTFVLRNKSRDE